MGTAIKPEEIKRFEATEVYSHPDAKVDIILVHGLTGHPRNTWTAKNGVFWPTDLLPVSLKTAKARILVYGYNADVYTFGNAKSASTDLIYQHAQTLVSNIALERKSEDVEDHPIIWVAHSLGGILVKRALELSNDLTSKNADDNRSVYVATYGIIFLGTPHTGADAAKWGLMLQSMVSALVPKKFMDSEAALVKTLQNNNETLQNINIHFLDIYQRFKICMVHEAEKTDMKGTRAYIVDQASAAPMLADVEYFGIEATHSGMVKFESKNSPGYLNVSMKLRSWVMEAPPIIQARLDMEKKSRRQIREAQAAELLGIYPAPIPASHTANTPDQVNSMNNSTIMVSSTISIPPDIESPPPPYFIKPSGFRPNSIFVGREEELAVMHKMLFDAKRRAEGTSAILIQSLPGGGKSHLARQYVYQHKDEFPGGIFWLRAKSQSELAAGFWDIAKKAALEPLGKQDPHALKSPQHFIKVVKKWLTERKEWLLVLDGIYFGDPEGLLRFIPDAPNTSLIYTSTEKSVSGSHLFMNPQVIRLPLLSAREAQKLLLLELDKKEPFHKDDLSYSMELVQAMGLLPVVIHTVAQRLKATDEPLGKFARHYSSEPRLRGLGAYTAVVEQLKILGAFEALNLIRILSFFNQHIPVEMIALGLKELDVPVKASEPVTGRSLNNTFKILNTFALIDRNEHQASLHSSQSSKSSADILSENVDVIRLHSVVQGFFVDTLSDDKCLPIWLGRAIKLFCSSYDSANERIERKSYAGLVEDYRLYEIHGIKLSQHVKRFLRKSPNFEEMNSMLQPRINSIQYEINRRTPESSQVIAGGRSDTLHASIFDRTSSSSDTGPETPGIFGISTWGLEAGKAQLESPDSIIYNRDIVYRPPTFTPVQFPPLPAPEDAGYDSDREGSVPMTLQPSQRTIRPDRQSSGEWQDVRSRRLRSKRGREDLHRTVKVMERQKYRDSAGAFRSVSVTDPRVSHETAQGSFERMESRPHSRGQISGRSNAEISLASITQNSPPPARAGGVMVQDRRPQSARGNLRAGTATYASALTGNTKETILSFREPMQMALEPLESSSEGTSSLLTNWPESPAVAALQRIPHQPPAQYFSTPSSSTLPLPYPSTPGLPYESSHPLSKAPVYQMPESPVQLDPDMDNRIPNSLPSNIYPRVSGPIPIEYRDSPITGQESQNVSSASWPKQAYSDDGFPPAHGYSENPPNLSLSSPNIKRPFEGEYPAQPKLPHYYDGYTSQPISRNPSGQSGPSNISSRSAEGSENRARRRPSLAETEPLPELPNFSSSLPPTSYQLYERMRQRDVSAEGERGRVRRSVRMEFPEEVQSENQSFNPTTSLQPPRRKFNPKAPSFSPRGTSRLSQSVSPRPTSAPWLGTPSSQRISPHLSNSPFTPPPVPIAPTAASDVYPTTGGGLPAVAPDMGRTLSGGLKVGRRMIEFGDFPEPVDYDLARERADRAWSEREDLSREALKRKLLQAGRDFKLQDLGQPKY